MAAYEVLLLNTAIPQIQAAQSGDTYVCPRDIAFSAALTLSAGTANGVPYLNGSKVLTSGSALTFDGTNLNVGNATVALGRVDVAKSTPTSAIVQSWQNSNDGARGAAIYLSGAAGSGLAMLASTASGYPLAFGVDGTEQMRLTSTGLGIGTSSPAYKLDVQTSAGRFQVQNYGAGSVLLNSDGAMAYKAATTGHQFFNASSQAMTLHASGGLSVGNTTDPGVGNIGLPNGGKLQYSATAYITPEDNISGARVVTGGIFVIATGGTAERARITSGGSFFLGVQSEGGNENGVTLNSSTGYQVIQHVNGTGSGTRYSYFYYNAGEIGSITQNGATGVLYNITSDYRLKNVVGAVTGAGARIDALKPVDYTWKTDGSAARGFLAHEFQEIYPNSVIGTKDAVDEEGKPIHQQMQASTSEVIADLVAELQSLRARVAQLEGK